MGRTGRRAGSVPNCTFLTTKHEATLQAAALLRLFRQGYVEPVRPSRRAFHIMAHQLMALTIQHRGLRRGEWFGWLDGATPFAETTAADRGELVDHMLASEILADQDGALWLGPAGQKRYGRRNFSELYAVFSTPRTLTVRWGAQEVGSVDAGFVEGLDADLHRAAFTLGARAWRVVRIEGAVKAVLAVG